MALETGKLAIVFGGGGSLGAFEIGVTKYLMTVVGRQPDMLVGASTGSLIAAKVAQDGAAGINTLDGLYRTTLNGFRKVFNFQPAFNNLMAAIEKAEADGASASSNVANFSRWDFVGFGWIADAFELFDALGVALLLEPIEKGGILDALLAFAKTQSINDPAPLKQLFRTVVDPAKIAAAGKPLRMAVSCLDSGELRFMTETGKLVDRENVDVGEPAYSLYDGMAASSALPLSFPPVTLGSNTYVDGGVRAMVPINMAQQLGAQVIVSIAADLPLRPGRAFSDETDQTGNPAPPYAGAGLIDVIRRVTDLMSDEISFGDFTTPVAMSEMQRVAIRPAIKLHDSSVFDLGLSAIASDYGFMVGADTFGAKPSQKAAALAAGATAEAITLLRYQAWVQEYALNLAPPVQPEYDAKINPASPKDPAATGPIRNVEPSTASVQAVRDTKTKIAGLVANRIASGLAVPGDWQNWFMTWEAHSESWHAYNGDGATPWDAFVDPGTNKAIAPAAPPPSIIG